MSTVIFDFTLERIVRNVLRTGSITLSDGTMLLAYADDIVIIEKT